MENNTLKLSMHYILYDDNRHSMNAVVYNECQRQILSSLYQIASILKLDDKDLNISVSAVKPGSVLDILTLDFSKDLFVGAFSALVAGWSNKFFGTKVDISEESKNNIEAAIKIKEGNFTADEALSLVKGNQKLEEYCSKYFKSVSSAAEISGVEVITADNKTQFVGKVAAKDFHSRIVNTHTDVNIVYGTTIIIASPVLADVKRLKWHGVYNTKPIVFDIEDTYFIDLVHNKQVTFEYETTIKCDIRIEEKKVGHKTSFKYSIVKVYSYSDAAQLIEGGKHYIKVDHGENVD
jgi:hypothetical protein